MAKTRLTINCDKEILGYIHRAAKENNMPMSSVAEMFLDLIRYVEIKDIRKISPLPQIFNLEPENREVQ